MVRDLWLAHYGGSPLADSPPRLDVLIGLEALPWWVAAAWRELHRLEARAGLPLTVPEAAA